MNGLYVHIPFCIKKCGYCDFVSYEDVKLLSSSYIDNVIKEAEEYKGEAADSVYIGGGTPTYLDKIDILRLISALNKIFKIEKGCEFTVEANPKTADYTYLCDLKREGVNRISLGVQSFSDVELSLLGRVHSADEALESISLIKQAGFSDFNLDLMFAIPAQTKSSFAQSLKTAVSVSPTHISCYSLILEENTPFYEKYHKYPPVSEDTELEMYNYAIDYLTDKGYKMYEISNFAKEGHCSRHNIKYWKRVPYIGLGAAAHSFFQGERYENPASLFEYEKRVQERIMPQKTVLSQKEQMSEFIFLGLRMNEGIKKSDFCASFGCDIESVYKNQLNRFLQLGLLIEDGDRYFLSKRGREISNSIFCEF